MQNIPFEVPGRLLNQPLFNRIIKFLPTDVPIYLVGGAVRDMFLDRQSYDLDFVTGGDAMKIARRLADDIDAAYFPLDFERKIARLVLNPDESRSTKNRPIRIDISAFQGADLQADLLARDFTINAMALEVFSKQTLVDPLGGAADLAARRLRACTSHAFIDDPIRILRAVRLSVDIELKILPDTLRWMREAASRLPEVSPERIRDELFRILSVQHPGTSLRLLDNMNVLGSFLPEVLDLKNLQQSHPHIFDVWDHTLSLVDRLEDLLDVLRVEFNPEKAENLTIGLAVMQLGRFRQQISDHLDNSLNPDRPHRGLLFLAGIYHDVGKYASRTIDEDGKTRFLGHEHNGGRMVAERGEALKLSNLEVNRLVTIVNHHMRPSLLSHPEAPPSRKAVYHFFRDTGVAGVDICILSVADVLATYGPTLPLERWARHLDTIRSLLQAWWEDQEDRIFPPEVINGFELMNALEISPGPMVGYLLEAIREAQINHEVKDKDDAIAFAQKLVQDNINKKTS
jgi:tRNA nucleotidyltransferase/poly(A) polymerase